MVRTGRYDKMDRNSRKEALPSSQFSYSHTYDNMNLDACRQHELLTFTHSRKSGSRSPKDAVERSTKEKMAAANTSHCRRRTASVDNMLSGRRSYEARL